MNRSLIIGLQLQTVAAAASAVAAAAAAASAASDAAAAKTTAIEQAITDIRIRYLSRPISFSVKCFPSLFKCNDLPVCPFV